MDEKKWIAVFAGSSEGTKSTYVTQARLLGAEIAKQGYGLLYGGSQLGLMGAVAAGAEGMGGRVKGVIPRPLAHAADLGLPHEAGGEYAFGPGDIEVVDTMHQRQARIHELASAYIALPGGFGTLAELFEALTFFHIGLHSKPIGLLNTYRYYDPLIRLISEHLIREGFVPSSYRPLIVHNSTPRLLLWDLMDSHEYMPKGQSFNWKEDVDGQ